MSEGGKLSGKVAVVTGGNSGIGLATAKELVGQGARVVITGRDQKTLDEAVRELGEAAWGVRADVSRLPEIDTLAAAVRERYGSVDILFVNAGLGKFASVESVTEELYDEMMDVNLKGAFFTIQKLLPLMDRGGSIILNSSISALIGMPNSSVYAASKAGVTTLGRTLAAELVDRGIRVNVVSPGPIRTPFLGRTGVPAEAVDATAEYLRQQVPMKRFAEPEEIAKAVLFLASDDSSFFLGADLVADGGMSQL